MNVLRLAIVVIVLLTACLLAPARGAPPATATSRPSSAPASQPTSRPAATENLVPVQLLVPDNMLSGERWRTHFSDAAEVRRVLETRMPRASEVPANATLDDVLVKLVGRKIVYIPKHPDDEVIEKQMREHPATYAELMERGDADAAMPTVGEYVRGIITSSNEFGMPTFRYLNYSPRHLFGDRDPSVTRPAPPDFELVETALITDDAIVIVALPHNRR